MMNDIRQISGSVPNGEGHHLNIDVDQADMSCKPGKAHSIKKKKGLKVYQK